METFFHGSAPETPQDYLSKRLPWQRWEAAGLWYEERQSGLGSDFLVEYRVPSRTFSAHSLFFYEPRASACGLSPGLFLAARWAAIPELWGPKRCPKESGS